jgi:hypothetical protein
MLVFRVAFAKASALRARHAEHGVLREQCSLVEPKRVSHPAASTKTKGHRDGWPFVSIWWRRRESNPRPQVLYRQFYILSPVNWVLTRIAPAEQARFKRVALDLTRSKATLDKAIILK